MRSPIVRAAAAAALLGLCAVPSGLLAQGEAVQLSGDSTTQVSPDVLDVQGHVKVIRRGMVLGCDKVRYDRVKMHLLAEGNVVVSDPTFTLTCGRLSYYTTPDVAFAFDAPRVTQVRRDPAGAVEESLDVSAFQINLYSGQQRLEGLERVRISRFVRKAPGELAAGAMPTIRAAWVRGPGGARGESETRGEHGARESSRARDAARATARDRDASARMSERPAEPPALEGTAALAGPAAASDAGMAGSGSGGDDGVPSSGAVWTGRDEMPASRTSDLSRSRDRARALMATDPYGEIDEDKAWRSPAAPPAAPAPPARPASRRAGVSQPPLAHPESASIGGASQGSTMDLDFRAFADALDLNMRSHRAVLKGQVTVESPTYSVEARRLVYDAMAARFTAVGEAKVVGYDPTGAITSTVTGNKIIHFIAERRSMVLGGVSGVIDTQKTVGRRALSPSVEQGTQKDAAAPASPGRAGAGGLGGGVSAAGSMRAGDTGASAASAGTPGAAGTADTAGTAGAGGDAWPR